MNTKKGVLLVSFFGSIFLSLLFFLGTDSCYKDVFCKEIRSFLSNEILTIFLLAPIILLLSLITYRTRDEVFRAWFNFAKWWVLVIIAVTLFVQNAGGGGGWGMNGGAFDAFFIGIFYVIFIIVSLIKIFNAYLKTKGE